MNRLMLDELKFLFPFECKFFKQDISEYGSNECCCKLCKINIDVPVFYKKFKKPCIYHITANPCCAAFKILFKYISFNVKDKKFLCGKRSNGRYYPCSSQCNLVFVGTEQKYKCGIKQIRYSRIASPDN